MDPIFERGDSQKPRGHALLYFTSTDVRDETWATYVVMLPITVDVSKYVPPFLMNQIGEAGAADLSVFAFPPSPEKLEGRDYMNRLADARDDDVVYVGSFNPGDTAGAMMMVSEAVQWYSRLYSEASPAQEPTGPTEPTRGLGVNEVMYGLMSDSDRLGELTRLVGRLRFATEGGEDGLAAEAEADIKLIAEHLPADTRVTRLVDVVRQGGEQGEMLANLYLQRCFHIVREEYERLAEVDKQIEDLEKGQPD